MSAMENLLIAGLVEALPEPGAVFTPARRDKWLIVAENVFELVYLKAGAPPEVVDRVDGVDRVDKVDRLDRVDRVDRVDKVDRVSVVDVAEVVQARPVLRLGRPLEKNKGVRGKKDKAVLTLERKKKGPGRERGPLYDAVRVVLLESDEPMTVRDIAGRIERRHKEVAGQFVNLKATLNNVCRRMEDGGELVSDVEEGLLVFSVKRECGKGFTTKDTKRTKEEEGVWYESRGQ